MAGAGATTLPESTLPHDLLVPEGRRTCTVTAAEVAQARRALAGSLLRQEVYAADGSDQADRPYRVDERRYAVELLQQQGAGPYAVFAVHPREQLDLTYERSLVEVAGTLLADPRVSHTAVLHVDAYGSVRRTVSVAYRRREHPATLSEQRSTHLRVELTTVAHLTAEDDRLRLGLPIESRAYELVGAPEPALVGGVVQPYPVDALAALVAQVVPPGAAGPSPDRQWPTEHWDWRGDPAAAGPARARLLDHRRTLYRSDDLTTTLPLGEVEPGAVPALSLALALTPGLLGSAFVTADGTALLPDPAVLSGRGGDQGGYVADADGWWVPDGRAFFDVGVDPDAPAATAAAELARARAHFFRPQLFVDPFGQPTLVTDDVYDLLAVSATDPVGNRSAAAYDYRVLAPDRLTDPNGNRELAAYDALGRVAATALAGRPGQVPPVDALDGIEPDPTTSDLQALAADPVGRAAGTLGSATTRLVHDPHRFRRCGQPPVSLILARSVHAGDPGAAAAPTRITLSFSDGFGQVLQTKVRAEAGPAPRRAAPTTSPSGDQTAGALELDATGAPVLVAVPQRWASTGRTVLDNKARPIGRHEAYFSGTPLFETEAELVETGRGAVLFHDPLGRLVATLHNDHTYEKAVLGPWRLQTFDANDTVLDDPRTDPDVSALVAGYFADQPANWQTWHQRRTTGPPDGAETVAADKAAAHARTPLTSDTDPQGAVVRTTVHNRVERASVLVDELATTRHVLDTVGQERVLVDPLGRTAARTDHDLTGATLNQARADSGRGWQLTDVAGNPIRAWHERGHRHRLVYDALRRPVARHVAAAPGVSEVLVEQTTWGDDPATGLSAAQAAALNLRTRVWRQRDGAAEVVNVGVDPAGGGQQAYDLAGRRLQSVRRLVADYRTDPDWAANPPPVLTEAETTGARYDVAGRVVALQTPDRRTLLPAYNEAGLLERLDLRETDGRTTPFLTGMEYDAKARPLAVEHANGVVTRSTYDDVTRRLTRLRSTRPVPADALATAILADPTVVQDLQHTYDATGNLTRVVDAAPPTLFHDNQQVVPVADYTYDALYQLVAATGREHVAQSVRVPDGPGGGRRDRPFAGDRAPSPLDLMALTGYTERYDYDLVGNLTAARHIAGAGGWTRDHAYGGPSRIDPTQTANRLTQTTVGGTAETYGYADAAGSDAGGAMTAIGGLGLIWDHDHRLRSVDLGGGGTAYYTYDRSGQRVRAVVESGGQPRAERVYGGGYERHRTFAPGGAGAVTVVQERTTLEIRAGSRCLARVDTATVSDGRVLAPADQVPVVRFQLGDPLGSSRVELDEQARLVTYEEYHPFGTTAFQAGATGAEVSRKRYRFAGQERDDETGLARHGDRWYAPWVGRWTSADPTGTADGINVYAYAHNRPVSTVDPSGQGGFEGFQEVLTDDPNARLFYDQERGIGVRRSRNATEVAQEIDTNVYGDPTITFDPDTIRPTVKAIPRDIKRMDPQTFMERWGVTPMQYDQLARALIPPPEPLTVPEDRTLYMGEGGRVGTADELADAELGDRIAGIQSTPVGSIAGAVTFAVTGGDVRAASEANGIGNQLDSIVWAAAGVGAGVKSLRANNAPPAGPVPKAPASPPANGAGGWQQGRLHLPVVNPHFGHDDPQPIAMGATQRVSDRLKADPALTNRYLRPSESAFASYGPWARRIVHGNAVERALAHGAAPTGLLTHTGDLRPAPKGGPDLVGNPGSPWAGLPVQITSYRGYETHVDHAPDNTVWGLYLY